MAEIINQTELRVIGMSRSGNHAIIQWILAQAPGRWCFLNCAEGKSNPFETARVMDDGEPYRVNYEGFDLERERQGDFTRKDWLVFNHEDAFLAHACSDAFEREHDAWVGPSRRRLDVLVLRDPFNLLASRLRALNFCEPVSVARRIWKQHARQFAGRPRRLRHGPVLINYNRWVAEMDYRRELAEQLGLPFTDEGVQDVAACAGGSSFDGLTFDGEARRMKVLERWRYYADKPHFWAIFDEQMIELSQQIFGPRPEMEQPLAHVAARA